MNSDVQYRVHTTRSGTMYKAGWAAVWGPLIGIKDYKAVAAQKNWDKVRALWYRRLATLRAAGWKAVQEHWPLAFMRNCPPFGVLTGTRVRPCHRVKLCPFCWGRFAMDTFLRASRLLYLGRDTVQGIRVIEFCRTYRFPHVTGSTIQILDTICRERNAELRQFRVKGQAGMVGSLVLYTLELHKDETVLKRRGLVITMSNEELLPEEGLRVKAHKMPNRRRLAAIVGRVCRYPAYQLKCPARRLLSFLEVAEKAKLRLSSYQGKMRQ